ncbi:hypothetical protein GCM10029992_01320 [Glycomyces albus]
MERLWPRYGVEWKPEDGRVDLAELFGRAAPVILEIGSGNGEAAAVMADADRDRDLLAVEVYPQGVADLMDRAEQRGLDNVRIYSGDALPLLWHGLAPGRWTRSGSTSPTRGRRSATTSAASSNRRTPRPCATSCGRTE